jgi:hypothetical protein
MNKNDTDNAGKIHIYCQYSNNPCRFYKDNLVNHDCLFLNPDNMCDNSFACYETVLVYLLKKYADKYIEIDKYQNIIASLKKEKNTMKSKKTIDKNPEIKKTTIKKTTEKKVPDKKKASKKTTAKKAALKKTVNKKATKKKEKK